MFRIAVPPLGRLALCADWLMRPVMRLLSGALREEPQRTHRWNNRRLSPEEVAVLNTDAMIRRAGDPDAMRFKPILFHIPCLGGWKKYVVVRPFSQRHQRWHIGWLTPHVNGMSLVQLEGPVRVLLGPEPVKFFGVDAQGEQIIVHCIGEGTIGDGSPYSRMPLL